MSRQSFPFSAHSLSLSLSLSLSVSCTLFLLCLFESKQVWVISRIVISLSQFWDYYLYHAIVLKPVSPFLGCPALRIQFQVSFSRWSALLDALNRNPTLLLRFGELISYGNESPLVYVLDFLVLLPKCRKMASSAGLQPCGLESPDADTHCRAIQR